MPKWPQKPLEKTGAQVTGLNFHMSFSKKTSHNLSNIPKEFGVLLIGTIIGSSILVAAFEYNPASSKSYSNNPLFVPEKNEPFLGRAKAPVTVIEYADPLCPGCKSFFDTIEPTLRSKYINKGFVKFYHRPMLISETSLPTLEAMYCASDQNKYWQYRDYMFSIPREVGTWATFENDDYIKFASAVKLNMPKFDKCFSEGKYEEWIHGKAQMVKDANIWTSATTIVNETIVVPSTLEDVSAAIDRVLINPSQK